MGVPRSTFSVVLFMFQVILLVLYATLVDYDESNEVFANATFYPTFQDVHVMIFIGFGFLMTFLQKYGFSAVGYNMLISAVVIQWAMLLNQWVTNAVADTPEPEKVVINVQKMIGADFTAGAVLITFGAVLGKVSRLQLLLIGIIESVFFAINEAVLIHELHIADVGGSIVIHAFGAYFGLAVAFVLRNQDTEEENEKEGSNYHSDLFAMIGTIFLWMYWPSFNGALLGGKPHQQGRAFVNTYISLAACCVTTFVTSPLVDKKSRLNMVHIQNATLAGGVAVGSCADLYINPWGAMLIGMLAGVISTLGYAYVTPVLNKYLRIHDTCGVHNLHGMPGLMSGICAAIAASTISDSDYTDVVNPGGVTNIYGKRGEWSRSKQAGYQMAAVCVGFGIAVGGGIITGLIVKWLDRPKKDELYDDQSFWEVPEVAVEAHYEMKSNVAMTNSNMA